MAKNSLVEQVESQFESIPKRLDESGTLAKYISDSLMSSMPRISPELFGLVRNAKIKLTQEQKEHIYNEYLDQYSAFTYRIRPNEFKYDLLKNARMEVNAPIPRFAYAVLPRKEEIIFSKSAEVTASTKLDISTSGRNHSCNEDTDFVISHYNDSSRCCGLVDDELVDGKKIKRYTFPSKAYGNVNLDITANWKSPFRLDVMAKVPEIPESFIALGDEVIATYYASLKVAPGRLRQKTSLCSPQLGILWAPNDESLCCVGKIPKAKAPRLSGDPILVLDISDKEKRHRHAVAAWSIDEELPFKYWLTEFSEGALGKLR